MIKWAILLVLVIVPIAFLIISSVGEKEIESSSVIEKTSILKVGQEFIDQASRDNSTEDSSPNKPTEITEEELIKMFRVADPDRNEKIINMGVRISTQYNHASFDYLSGKITDLNYYTILYNLREDYYAYLTFSDSYVGEGDILVQKKSMIEELKEITDQITILKNSKKFEIPKYLSEDEKYKKFLPGMFAP